MFHRLTLFDMSNELNVVAVNQAFQALQVETYNN
ncbi:MAG: hypothetical protein ACI9AH_000606, partial [Oceanospirillaceae bacterium]